MKETTCAACDCKIEGDAIKVNIGGKAVEVCCEECAERLREARVSAEEDGEPEYARRSPRSPRRNRRSESGIRSPDLVNPFEFCIFLAILGDLGEIFFF